MTEPLSTPIETVKFDGSEPMPERVAFTETPLPKEPPTDRLITLADGTFHRERVTLVDARSDAVRTSAPTSAPTAFTMVFSHALANADGSVVTDAEGRPIIAPVHELALSADALARLEEGGNLDAEVEAARERATAQAAAAFKGMQAGEALVARFTKGAEK